MTWKSKISILACACLLTACGGGGGGSSNSSGGDGGAALASLQGSWLTACSVADEGRSTRLRFVFADNRQTSFFDVFSDSEHCSTTPNSEQSFMNAATIVVGDEVTTAGGMTARKVDITFDGAEPGEEKLTIFLVDQNGMRLLLGDPNGTKDNDGRDSQLNFDLPLTKGEPPTSQNPTNSAPEVSVSDDFAAVSGSTALLHGSAEDVDNNVATVLWEQTAGTVVTIIDADSTNAQFTAPVVSEAEELRFRFTATDHGGLSGSDEVQVTVVPPDPSNRCQTDPDGGFDCATKVIGTEPDGGFTLNGNLSDIDDEDFYEIEAPEGTGSVRIETTGDTPGSKSDPQCFLYNIARAELANDDDSGEDFNCLIEQDITGGIYYIRLNTRSISFSGDYSLKVSFELEPAAPTAPPTETQTSRGCTPSDRDGNFECANDLGFIQGGQSVDGRLNGPTMDYASFYSFTVNDLQGTRLNVTFTDLSGGTLDRACQLYDSNQNIVISNSCNISDEGLQNGEYFFDVFALNTGSFGDYRVHFSWD